MSRRILAMPSKQQDPSLLPMRSSLFVSHFACYLHVRKPPRASIVRALIGFVINGVDFSDTVSPPCLAASRAGSPKS